MNWPSTTHALLRIMTGFLFVPHGVQKLWGLGGAGPKEGALILIAGWIEVVGGALVLLGWHTRWTAFLCSGLMAVAYFMAHASGGFLPLLNRGETAVLYCFIFLYLWASGSGDWSIDSWLAKRKRA